MRAARMFSQLESVSSTRLPRFCRALPSSLATGLAPMIRKPEGAGSATFSRRASGRAVALCSTTVPMITRKVRGTSRCARSWPASCRRRANTADTAAATMPRGAIQASSARSRQFRLEPAVLTATQSGRATNWITASSNRVAGPMVNSALKSRRAASRMNSPEISSTLRFSLKCRICRTSTPRMLASHMPMMVTASRPDSLTSRLAVMNTPSTAARAARFCRYSGSQWRRSSWPNSQPPMAPSAAPQAITAAKVARPALRPPPWSSRLTMKLNTTTASSAPMGSMTMPSQRRMLAIDGFGRTTRSMGTITVGPVTSVRVPNSSARSQEKSSSQWVARVITAQVSRAPMVTMRCTTRPISRHSEKCRVRLPSNRISATDREISGNSSGPNSACGSSRPVAGPAMMPASSRKRIAGRRRRQASHWQNNAAAPMPPKPSRIWCSLIWIPFRDETLLAL
ncbi:hypothetical protein FQZ97_701140 [compost metagenome]